MDIHSPRSLDEALALRAAHPEAVIISGGTDIMVQMNFRRLRPAAMLNLAEVPELRGWSLDGDVVRIGAALTYTELQAPDLARLLPALAEAARSVGSPQIRNRGTIGGNLGTASPAGDALPPLLVNGAEVELASVRGRRSVPLKSFLLGPRRNGLAADEIITAVTAGTGGRQTFLKVGPRNAMVISVVSLAIRIDEAKGTVRGAFGSAAPTAILLEEPLGQEDGFPDRLAAAAAPIDDIRGTAAYRRHALGILARRALARLRSGDQTC
ncbi:FAD binding domain-containing protein [Enterovirga sp. CN4-39]|uniref:FAD binding domain-containing protein n=1 Tax=Enterovirga sp. CN4-39 TaxID=3400910 RepID=UPI003BFD620F